MRSASRLLGFSASRLLGFSASRLLGFSASRLLGFCAVTFALCATEPPLAHAQSYHSGDLDGLREKDEGTVRLVTEADATCATDLALAILLNSPPPGCLAVSVAQADMNCTGTFNVSDVVLVNLLLGAPDDPDSVDALRVTDPNYELESLYLNSNCASLACPYSNSGFSAVAAGYQSTCAIAEEGDLWCWGNDEEGTLGNYLRFTSGGEESPVITNREGQYSAICTSDATGFAIGHTCGIRADDSTLWCWGNSDFGQAGVDDDDFEFLQTPFRVGTGADEWEALACGSRHTCAIRKDGSDNELFCWGRNSNGQLGIDTTSNNPEDTPQLVANPTDGGTPSNWGMVTAGDQFTCATLQNGDAYCWGAGSIGQLGYGSLINRDEPELVAGSHSWTTLAASTQHACGVTTAGDLYCWGRGEEGQLGIYPRPSCSSGVDCASSPALVDSSDDWVKLWTGRGHVCGITGGGSSRLKCWGDNSDDQLGYSTSPYSFADTPGNVDSSADWLFGAAGREYTCAGKEVSGDVVLYCWGLNDSGQLGIGSTSSASTPAAIDALQLSCCGDSSCDEPENAGTCSGDCY